MSSMKSFDEFAKKTPMMCRFTFAEAKIVKLEINTLAETE